MSRPWEEMPDWERASARAVYDQVRDFVAATNGSTVRLSRAQRGRFVALCWIGQVLGVGAGLRSSGECRAGAAPGAGPPGGGCARAQCPRGEWPGTVRAVAKLLDEGLDLGPATVLVGENGSGKSTVAPATPGHPAE